MYLVKYKFEVTNLEGTVKFGCLELMDESDKQYALNYIEEYYPKVDCVTAYVGEECITGEVPVYLDDIREAIEEAEEISDEDGEAFKRMFEGTTYGEITWDYIEDRIFDEAEEYDEDEEDEWEAAARECS